MIWLKFNIYSLLLSFIGMGFILFAVLDPFGHTVWISTTCIIIACLLYKKAIQIFSKYNYKKEIYYKLIDKSKKRYDQRYFIPYMESPCMRSVVYFSLCEINQQKDYIEIKRRANSDNKIFEESRVVTMKQNKNGKLKFTAYDRITGEQEEI